MARDSLAASSGANPALVRGRVLSPFAGREHESALIAAAATIEEALETAGHLCIGREMIERPRVALGRREDARAQVERCREIVARGEDWRWTGGQALLAEAALAASDHQLEEAEGLFEHAIEVFRRYHLPWDEAEAFETWGEALAAAGRRPLFLYDVVLIDSPESEADIMEGLADLAAIRASIIGAETVITDLR
ncbi:MAG: hypothetical protein HS107_05945 [Thermoflexaceae bacterium]|nr:hypothetical protein [Thermoflexaceae bacterium]